MVLSGTVGVCPDNAMKMNKPHFASRITQSDPIGLLESIGWGHELCHGIPCGNFADPERI
jgi:hypothetical protein